MRQRLLTRILLVAPSSAALDAIEADLSQDGYATRVRLIENEPALLHALHAQIWNLCLLDIDHARFPVERASAVIRKSGQDIPLIVLHEPKDGDASAIYAAALPAGAIDAIERGDSLHLHHAVRRELSRLADRRALRALKLTLRQSEERYRHLLDKCGKALACVQGGKHVLANAGYLGIFGYSGLQDLRSRSLTDLVGPDDRAAFSEFLEGYGPLAQEPALLEVCGLRKDGRTIRVAMEICHVTLEGRRCLQVQVQNLGARDAGGADPDTRPAQGQGADAGESGPTTTPPESRMARDLVTGFYTRRHFEPLVNEAISRALEKNVQSSLVYIELQDISKLLAQLGAERARQYLKKVGDIIVLKISPDDVVARLEKDAFAVLMPDKSVTHASTLGKRIRRGIEETHTRINGKHLALRSNVGVAPISGKQTSYTEVLANAFSACRAARRGNVNDVVTYEPAGDAAGHLEGMQHLSVDILEALHKHRFTLEFQPIVRLTGEPRSFYEVLLRVEDWRGELIPTQAIFPVAEEHKLDTLIDEWVIDNALRVLREQRRDAGEICFFLKLSKEAFTDRKILFVLDRYLRQNDIPPQALIIEISELDADGNASMTGAFLEGLRKLKCPSTLENFGPSIASFKLAERLPVDYLKVDPSLIMHLAEDTESLKTLEAIVKLATSMNKLTIAPGVESARILEVLFGCGVDFAQGNYIQRPSPHLAFDFCSDPEPEG